MSVSAHMLVKDVDRHEGFDMVKMQADGADGLDGSLELSVTDPDLVGSFQPGAGYDLSLMASEVTTDDASADNADTDTDTDAAEDDTSVSASSATSSTEDTATAE